MPLQSSWGFPTIVRRASSWHSGLLWWMRALQSVSKTIIHCRYWLLTVFCSRTLQWLWAPRAKVHSNKRDKQQQQQQINPTRLATQKECCLKFKRYFKWLESNGSSFYWVKNDIIGDWWLWLAILEQRSSQSGTRARIASFLCRCWK